MVFVTILRDLNKCLLLFQFVKESAGFGLTLTFIIILMVALAVLHFTLLPRFVVRFITKGSPTVQSSDWMELWHSVVKGKADKSSATTPSKSGSTCQNQCSFKACWLVVVSDDLYM